MVEFGVIGGRLYEVWEVYGDHLGVIGVVYIKFGMCMGIIRGYLYEVWELYGEPLGVIDRSGFFEV